MIFLKIAENFRKYSEINGKITVEFRTVRKRSEKYISEVSFET